MDYEEDQLIEQTRLCQLEELASDRWLLHHQAVVQLSLKAVSQTAQLREETVYAKLMEAEKGFSKCGSHGSAQRFHFFFVTSFPVQVSLLVYDAILIEIWREEILPHLLKTESSLSPLMIYSVLYHEGAVISLLELLLYHSAACEALGDSIVDLLDYCHRTLLRSAAATASSRNHPSLADSPILKHLDVSHLEANIAIRCIAILRFLAGHADNLSEIVTSRMLTTTDVPLLAVQLLMDQQPWIRRVRRQSDVDDESGSRNNGGDDDDDEMLEIYDNGQWRRCSHDEASGSSGGQIHPVAAHLWLLLLSLLMSPVAPRKYDLNDFRCQQLLKLRSSLNPYVIDQIPPLAEFEQWLVQLSIVGAHQVWRHSGSSLQKPFILELVAEMRQLMLKQLAAEWTAILDGQRQFLSDESPETIHRFLCQLSSYIPLMTC
ncbi:hypothetical protein DAPPUDRAFT_312479 [Daphnia pulex]|uniref:Uncharacterized protein n=1 Tax=Daphnia pulex TaxID=6669 RepID=E9G0Z3_DAPPU|nr:hypothetical protein DAPPUDRAFT_312479 [Daphnia pulex]|eukprot:EFX86992.1 hypothetical protein DAPPUDRAFT_312479 [Daphnia pulex]